MTPLWKAGKDELKHLGVVVAGLALSALLLATVWPREFCDILQMLRCILYGDCNPYGEG